MKFIDSIGGSILLGLVLIVSGVSFVQFGVEIIQVFFLGFDLLIFVRLKLWRSIVQD